jgi:hypothetical protein
MSRTGFRDSPDGEGAERNHEGGDGDGPRHVGENVEIAHEAVGEGRRRDETARDDHQPDRNRQFTLVEAARDVKRLTRALWKTRREFGVGKSGQECSGRSNQKRHRRIETCHACDLAYQDVDARSDDGSESVEGEQRQRQRSPQRRRFGRRRHGCRSPVQGRGLGAFRESAGHWTSFRTSGAPGQIRALPSLSDPIATVRQMMLRVPHRVWLT